MALQRTRRAPACIALLRTPSAAPPSRLSFGTAGRIIDSLRLDAFASTGIVSVRLNSTHTRGR